MNENPNTHRSLVEAMGSRRAAPSGTEGASPAAPPSGPASSLTAAIAARQERTADGAATPAPEAACSCHSGSDAEGACGCTHDAAASDPRADPTEGCGCRHKHTPRSEELQRDLNKRLNRVIGQLNGVKAMLDDNRYCGDVLMQLSASQSALRSISRIILQEHLETCIVEQIQSGHTESIAELMKLLKSFS